MLPAAILSGGLATRLRPITETIPKAMISIAGEPFVAHQLRLLRARGIDRVVICAGYLGETIREFVRDGAPFGIDVDYSWDGPTLQGTAGAVRNALPLLGEKFFVLYGDSYLPCDYAQTETIFMKSGRPGLMTVFPNDGRWDSSNVEFDNGRIIDYNKRVRTPAMRHIDYGLGVFQGSVFAGLPPGPYDLADVYADLLARDELAAAEVPERFYETGSVAGIAELSALLTGQDAIHQRL
jgi:NDP-sugar pyrophosphorylase family protein